MKATNTTVTLTQSFSEYQEKYSFCYNKEKTLESPIEQHINLPVHCVTSNSEGLQIDSCNDDNNYDDIQNLTLDNTHLSLIDTGSSQTFNSPITFFVLNDTSKFVQILCIYLIFFML